MAPRQRAAPEACRQHFAALDLERWVRNGRRFRDGAGDSSTSFELLLTCGQPDGESEWKATALFLGSTLVSVCSSTCTRSVRSSGRRGTPLRARPTSSLISSLQGLAISEAECTTRH